MNECPTPNHCVVGGSATDPDGTNINEHGVLVVSTIFIAVLALNFLGALWPLQVRRRGTARSHRGTHLSSLMRNLLCCILWKAIMKLIEFKTDNHCKFIPFLCVTDHYVSSYVGFGARGSRLACIR